MLKVTLKICVYRAVRQFIIDNGGKPKLAVHKPTLIAQGGYLDTLSIDSNGVVHLHIGKNSVRDYTELDEGILFRARFDGESKKCLIPWLSVLSVYDESNPIDNISFSLEMDTQRQNAQYDAASSEVSSILAQFSK